MINTTADWMNELAEALRNGDESRIDELENISYGWLQSREERGAQQNLVEACYDVMLTGCLD